MILPNGMKKIIKGDYSKIKQILPYDGQEDESAILYIPNSVTSIGDRVFYDCNKLHCILNNTQYNDQVLQEINYVPFVDIKLDDYIPISYCLNYRHCMFVLCFTLRTANLCEKMTFYTVINRFGIYFYI